MAHSRRLRNQGDRCLGCGLRADDCICAMAPELGIRTAFVILSHAKEVQRASNTARLACLVMPGTPILVRGLRDAPVPEAAFRRDGLESFILYPGADARELDAEFARSRLAPPLIIVPDGSWRQAAGAVRREPGLRGLPCLKLPAGPPSRYALRTQPAPGKVSTFEAIARVVGILEGEEKRRALEEFLDEMVRRTLAACGNPGRAPWLA